MARILGVDLPVRKKTTVALTYIYGIGYHRAKEVLQKTKISEDKRIAELSDNELSKIAQVIESNYEIEGSLRRKVAMSVRRLQQINSYRGIRHSRSLPVRGQRTKTNARTRKGKKRTVGAVRDKATRKMSK